MSNDMKWTKVSEQLPEIDVPVLLLFKEAIERDYLPVIACRIKKEEIQEEDLRKYKKSDHLQAAYAEDGYVQGAYYEWVLIDHCQCSTYNDLNLFPLKMADYWMPLPILPPDLE